MAEKVFDIRIIDASGYNEAMKLYRDIFGTMENPMVPNKAMCEFIARKCLFDGGGIGAYENNQLVGILLSYDYGAVLANKALWSQYFQKDKDGYLLYPLVHRDLTALVDNHETVRFLFALGIREDFREQDYAKALAAKWLELYSDIACCAFFWGEGGGTGTWIFERLSWSGKWEFDWKYTDIFLHYFMTNRKVLDDCQYISGLGHYWLDDDERPGFFKRLSMRRELRRLVIETDKDGLKLRQAIEWHKKHREVYVDPAYWAQASTHKLSKRYYRRAVLEALLDKKRLKQSRNNKRERSGDDFEPQPILAKIIANPTPEVVLRAKFEAEQKYFDDKVRAWLAQYDSEGHLKPGVFESAKYIPNMTYEFLSMTDEEQAAFVIEQKKKYGVL